MYGTNHLKVAKSYLYTLTMRLKNATFSKKDVVDTVHFNHTIAFCITIISTKRCQYFRMLPA